MDTLVVSIADVKMTVVVDRQTLRLQLLVHSRKLSLHSPFQLICDHIVSLDPTDTITGDQQFSGSHSRKTHAMVEVLSAEREHNVGDSCEYRRIDSAVKPNNGLRFSGIVHQQEGAG